MGLSLKPDKENKNWREDNFNLRTLKSLATKANIKSEEADDSNTVFSDPTFTIAYAPTWVQSHSASATWFIPYYPTIKDIFSAAGAWMQVLASATTSDIYTVTIEIPKSQISMLAKKGDTLVDQGGNLYLMNALMLSVHTSLGHLISKPTVNGDNNETNILQSSLAPSYTKEYIP